jgi:hypothetical protein
MTVLAITGYGVRVSRRAAKADEIGPAQTGAVEDLDESRTRAAAREAEAPAGQD